MPNHVHALFDTSVQLIDEHNLILDEVPEDYIQLHTIMKHLKGSTAFLANLFLDRRGAFWAKDGSYSLKYPIKNRSIRCRILVDEQP